MNNLKKLIIANRYPLSLCILVIIVLISNTIIYQSVDEVKKNRSLNKNKLSSLKKNLDTTIAHVNVDELKYNIKIDSTSSVLPYIFALEEKIDLNQKHYASQLDSLQKALISLQDESSKQIDNLKKENKFIRTEINFINHYSTNTLSTPSASPESVK